MNVLHAFLAGLAGGAVVAAVVFLALPPRERELQPVAPPTSEAQLGELAAAIARLGQKIDSLERARSVREAPNERAPVVPAEGEADPVPLSKTEELHEDVRQLSARLDMLTLALQEHQKPSFSLPTLEQVHAARRDVDWKWLGELAELFLRDEDAAQEKARLMTFEQLLKRVGVPSLIARDNGYWIYFRPEHLEGGWRAIDFGFVGDSVSFVRAEK